MKRLSIVLAAIVSVILIGVLIFGFLLINKKNAQIETLKREIINKNNDISKLKKDLENVQTDNSKQHPIDLAVQKCMEDKNYTTYGMSQCVDDSIDEWNKEIEKYIKLLKNTLPSKSYELLTVSQEKWSEYKKAQTDFNNNAVAQKSGTIYINITSGLNAYIVEQRAKDLEDLYKTINDIEP